MRIFENDMQASIPVRGDKGTSVRTNDDTRTENSLCNTYSLIVFKYYLSSITHRQLSPSKKSQLVRCNLWNDFFRPVLSVLQVAASESSSDLSSRPVLVCGFGTLEIVALLIALVYLSQQSGGFLHTVEQRLT